MLSVQGVIVHAMVYLKNRLVSSTITPLGTLSESQDPTPKSIGPLMALPSKKKFFGINPELSSLSEILEWGSRLAQHAAEANVKNPIQLLSQSASVLHYDDPPPPLLSRDLDL